MLHIKVQFVKISSLLLIMITLKNTLINVNFIFIKFSHRHSKPFDYVN